jgi:hypothetical protein
MLSDIQPTMSSSSCDAAEPRIIPINVRSPSGQIDPQPPGGHVKHPDTGTEVSCNSDHHPDICSVGLVRLGISIHMVLRVVASSMPIVTPWHFSQDQASISLLAGKESVMDLYLSISFRSKLGHEDGKFLQECGVTSATRSQTTKANNQ